MSLVYDVRVLVVDVDPVLADCFSDTLRTLGYNVRSAHDAEAALQAAQEFDPHALIAEVVMPGTNGIDLANRFAREHPQCKVLLTSARQFVVETLENLPEGVLDFARKPLNLIDVIEFLATCRPGEENRSGAGSSLTASRLC